METRLPGPETRHVSGELSSGLDAQETKGNPGRSCENSAGANNEAGGQREGLDDSLNERSTRSHASLRFGNSGRSNQTYCKRPQGQELSRAETRAPTSLETAVALDALILCKHCGKFIQRHDRELHRRTEHHIAKKTLRCKLLSLNDEKAKLLESEYSNYQRYIRGNKTAPLYSATRQ